MRPHLSLALLGSLVLTACAGGGGSGSTNPGTGAPGQPQGQTAAGAAIAAANSIGTPVKNFASYDAAVSPAAAGAASSAAVRPNASGACSGGIEFFAPDRKGDPNSTETRWFYDAACSQLARDQVRLFTAAGSGSENVAATTSLYAPGNATPIAVRTDANVITGATFDTNGFPIAADGFYRSSSETLNISGSKTIDSGDEIVMLAQSGGSEQFCGDSAGYNATGFASLNQTFGWQGIASGGTRTPNADGSVTWSATHAGTNVQGAIGSLSLQTGGASNGCPISTPRYTIAGGTPGGAYTLPITATFRRGLLTGLTISGATLANGDTLNVATNGAVLPTNALFVQGNVANGSSPVATFSVDAFGDGTLTIASSGKQFVITDWHVVR
ncbi:MAG: hypothetical protein ACLQPV_11055 [Vulcanimicrobiaceae bacterium]